MLWETNSLCDRCGIDPTNIITVTTRYSPRIPPKTCPTYNERDKQVTSRSNQMTHYASNICTINIHKKRLKCTFAKPIRSTLDFWKWRVLYHLVCLILPSLKSCYQQRKTTCLLSIRKSPASTRASQLTTTNMYIAIARCENQSVVKSVRLNAHLS